MTNLLRLCVLPEVPCGEGAPPVVFLSLGFTVPRGSSAPDGGSHLLGEKRGWFYAKNTYEEEETARVWTGCPDRSAEHRDH